MKKNELILMSSIIRIIILTSLLLMAGVVGCSDRDEIKNGLHEKSIKYTSICEMLGHQNHYGGNVVRIDAVLKADNSSYAYFEDKQISSTTAMEIRWYLWPVLLLCMARVLLDLLMPWMSIVKDGIWASAW